MSVRSSGSILRLANCPISADADFQNLHARGNHDTDLNEGNGVEPSFFAGQEIAVRQYFSILSAGANVDGKPREE